MAAFAFSLQTCRERREGHFGNPPRYFEYFVRTAKANLLEFAPATAQKNINLEILTSVLIPLPPLAEQHRIVAKVDALMVLCDQLEASLDAASTTRLRFLDALLAEALAPVETQERLDCRTRLKISLAGFNLLAGRKTNSSAISSSSLSLTTVSIIFSYGRSDTVNTV
jgi:Type I restriction modification DNA specificity domain